MKKLLYLSFVAALSLLFSGLAIAETIVIKPEYGQRVIAPDNDQTISILIKFKARPLPPQSARNPLSLALVIDRSGSMDEAGKMNYAKLAARDLINRLGDKDQLSLITYDSKVQLLKPLTKMSGANKSAFIKIVNDIYASGSTNLSGGMQEGFKQLIKADSAGVKRVILLSDGLANVGETTPSRIAALAANARQKGITLTAMGMGLDYDEDLMQLIAQRGGGRYYYIRNAEDSSMFFNRDLDGALASVSRNIKLLITLDDKVQDIKVYGYTLSGEGRTRHIEISDFYADEERLMIIEMRVAKAEPGELNLGAIELNYEDIADKGQVALVMPMIISVDADAARQEQSRNKDVQVEVAAMRANENYSNALSAASDGRFEEAEQIMTQAKAELAANPMTAQSERLALQQRSLDVEEQRLRSAAAAPAPAQQDFIKTAKVMVYNTNTGNLNSLQMQEGSQGLEVELLQKTLNGLGYYNGPIDGNYSQAVAAAVQKFQADNGLASDGVAGPDTQNALGLY